jgi:hypothetical protein
MADEPAIVRQVLRCRKCHGRFTTHTHHPAGGAPNLEAPYGKVASSRMTSELGRFSSGPALIASFDDDDDLPPMVAGPNDSNYEITVALESELDDSQFEIPAIAETAHAPHASRPALARLLSGLEPFPRDSRYYDRIDSWIRVGFFGVPVLCGPSLLLIGFFILRSFLVGQVIHSSTTALILGFVGTTAIVLIMITLTALNLILLDLAKNTSQLPSAAPGARVSE